MKLVSIQLENFRGLAKQTINLEPVHFWAGKLQPIVFIGGNGSGKSSLLDAIAMLLSWMTARLSNPRGRGRTLEEKDISIPNATSAKLCIRLEPSPQWTISWLLDRTRKGLNIKTTGKTTGKYETLNNWLEYHRNHYQHDSKKSFPTIVYYPSDRRFNSYSLVSIQKRGFTQLDAYENCFEPQKNNFQSFFEWFNYQSAVENYQRLDEDLNYKDPNLSAVRNAIPHILKGFENLRIVRTSSSTKLVIDKEGVPLNVEMLSDGEKNLLTLAGDLARRLAIANPGLSDPLQGEAIVLIDEIELHLHPQWQSTIIENLCKTFPNCQFILTTHSPQIITNLESVYLLTPSSDGIICESVRTYGKDSNRILETIMGAPERSKQIQQEFDRLFNLIDKNQFTEARQLRLKLLEELQDDAPELVRATWIIKRREALGTLEREPS
jgi:predicted ATP-binding protein involved in virulence